MTTLLSDSDYARAEQMLFPHRSRRVPGTVLTPQWFANGARFWYRIGTRYVAVDPDAKTRCAAFDHDALAAALSAASGQAVPGADLPIVAVDVRADDTVLFSAFGRNWQWADSTCTESDTAATIPGAIPSPDERWDAFGREGNIWVRSRADGTEHALTDDAEPYFEYGGLPDTTSARALTRALGIPAPMILHWSPDSTRILVARIDQREVPELVLVESSPAD
ncbi:DPP IV N-terminal domain-containing protein, partial [Mycobacteroides chelonae]|uniref:DPP IV N-terminal domain-containing protein n=1 Tax=Mycobacteroides chelonae TaxID=1774 RepID=UPI001A958F33